MNRMIENERATRLPACLAGSLIGLAASLLLAACSLPGYDSGSIDGAWYDFDSSSSETYETYEEANREDIDGEIDYEPRVFQITPRLIARQRAERDEMMLSEEELAVSSEPTQVVNYRVGPGDVLQVVVFGHPELTNPGGGGSEGGAGQLIAADGTFFYPYVGDIEAEGKTVKELREVITQGLSQYIRQPQVDIQVSQYRSQRVYISGDIAQPCSVPISDVALTVLQALSQCSTLGTNQSGGVGVQSLNLIRNGETYSLDLNQVYATGRPIPLEPGDRLLVDDSANRVFMVGEFGSQRALPYSTGGMSLTDAIADAGGVNLASADTSAIYVVRGFIGRGVTADGGVVARMRPDVYKLDASSPSGFLLANQFELQPRDVVFAAPASFVNFNRALSLILPSVSAIAQTTFLYDRLRRDRR